MSDIFFHHLLPIQNAAPLVKSYDSQLIWPSIYLFVCLTLLVFIKHNSLTALIKVFQSTFNFNGFRKYEREESGIFRFFNLSLGLFYVLNLSFLACKVNAYYQLILYQHSFLNQFLFFFVTITLLMFYKVLLNQFIILMTRENRLISDYLYISSNVNQSAGLLLFPLMVLNAFSAFYPQFILITSLILLALFLAVKWFKGAMMGIVEERIGLLQIFSYFCALEILPGLMVAKYIVETF